jgi:hypothetical protein
MRSLASLRRLDIDHFFLLSKRHLAGSALVLIDEQNAASPAFGLPQALISPNKNTTWWCGLAKKTEDPCVPFVYDRR